MLVGYYSGGKIKSFKITTDKIVLCIPMLTKNGRKVTPLTALTKVNATWNPTSRTSDIPVMLMESY